MKIIRSALAVRRALIAGVCLWTGVLASGASADVLEKMATTGKLNVCSVDGLMPYSSSDPSYPGYEAEIAKAAAKRLGAEVEFVWVTWDALIPALTSERCDVIIDGMYITEERQKIIDFSQPYLSNGEAILVRGDNTDIKGLDDLRGRTTGVLAGSITVNILEGKGIGPLSIYNDQPSSLIELANGRVDAVYIESPAAGYALKTDSSKGLRMVAEYVPDATELFNVGAGVRKGEDAFLKKLNEALSQMLASGEIKEILDRYGVPFFPPT
ncbi:amino acid ABC transporter substrate-binding protein (plasmid) [Aminobacter sp. SR38]|uniref:substrate-binding periplasmic protein n=1 Tax=Aminobacter sp. SR38 TaxID=2774562 RepID=UPI001785AF0D|nr:transporter substrate-binding domain-containing protein [Aminobacter sp. SR38]QOF75100.1 amino acid ABC transporter substrate-binding protein [Aminobacter sp. SR38]